MQEVFLKEIFDGFDRLLKEFPEERRRLLDQMGQEALTSVRSQIGGYGKVQSWQDKYVGSGGGYVAVRPKSDTYQTTGKGQRYAVGLVTNAIESGHKVRVPQSGRKSRAKKSNVPGRFFYYYAKQEAQRIAQKYAEQFAKKMKELLEG